METSEFFNRKAVNLDLTSKCTLACIYCGRAELKNIPSYYMTEKEFDCYLNFFHYFTFCGQISDPIMHPKLPLFLNKVYKAGKGSGVHVAASHKPKSFFIECFKANPDALWCFGIDGLPQDSHKYRVRQDGMKLFNIMVESAKYLRQKPIWQYIIFDYNENDIEEALRLSNLHKVEFKLIMSSRWDKNNYLKPQVNDYSLLNERNIL